MIPHKIELKNFLSYGEPVQTIDFRQHAFICLSGKNGNGKSALLDAITWALWGQARKIGSSTKADEGLLKLGTTRMMVGLEFEVNHTIYRVRREFAKTYGRALTVLDYEIYDDHSAKFMPLTDKTIRATQEKIEKTIGIDYETFINSAFLRQGQANEFSKKTAKDRKQILATILGLAHYDNLAQLALEQGRGYADEKKLLTSQHALWLEECHHEPALIESITQTKIFIAQTLESLTQQTDQIRSHEAEHRLLSQKIADHLERQRAITSLASSIDLKQTELRKLIQAWKTTHKTLLPRESITELEAQKQICDNEFKQLLTQKHSSLDLQEKLLRLKEQHATLAHTFKQESDAGIMQQQLILQKLELEQKQLQGALNSKETQTQTLCKKIELATKEYQTIKTFLDATATLEAEAASVKKQFEKRKLFYQAMVQKGNWLKASFAELEQKKTTLHNTETPSCPLCEQVLTIKRKQFLHTQFDHQELALNRRLMRISTILKTLKDLLYTQHQELERFTTELERIKAHRSALDECEKKKTLLSEELAVVEQETVALHEQAIIHTQAYSCAQAKLGQLQEAQAQQQQPTALIDLQTKIALLESEKNNTPFDQTKFDAVQQKLSLLEQKITLTRTQQQQQEQQHKRRTAIGQACQELKSLKHALAAQRMLLSSYGTDREALDRSDALLKTLKFSLEESVTQKDTALQTLGKYEHALQRIHTLKEQIAIAAEKIVFFDEQCNDYQLLAQAFNKNGIQALLIEQAIPEIETEANNLLAKLTDNQSHIFIESLKDLKSGGVKETLDIHISDAAGIRPYEMFSGGEAFRVDFALRIAISKLLARRAGSALQTLIIDEGFGSQDEEGLAHIMDALYMIQKDFAKIIIVSHLSEFKDNFPVHFIIDKKSTGSTISVQERG